MSANALAGSKKKPANVLKAVFTASAVAWLVSSDEEECKVTAKSPRDVLTPTCPPISTDRNRDPADLVADPVRHFLGRPLASFTSDFPSSSLSEYYRFPKKSSLPSLKTKLPIQVSGRVYTREFHELGRMGSGAFGTVFRSQNLLDGNTYAVKKIRMPLTNRSRQRLDANAVGEIVDPFVLPDDIWTILREPQVMATVCKHRNIVRYHHSWLEIHPNWTNNDPDSNSSILRRMPSPDLSLIPSTKTSIGPDHELDADWSDGYGSEEDEADSTFDASCSSPDDYSLVLFIQMELCTGASLYDWLRLPGRTIDAAESMQLFKQLIRGLSHLHVKGYCHRDVKPANLLMAPKEGKNRLKVGDFGSCKRLSCDVDIDGAPPTASTAHVVSQSESRFVPKHVQHTEGCGTFFYMAPELHTQRYDTSVDIFAAGIVLFELFHVFSTEMERISMLTQLHEKRLVPRSFIHSYPAEANLVLKMTHSDPTQRPTASELLNDPRYGLCPIQDLDTIIP